MIIRQAVPGDAAAMAQLINQIIQIGGTTAHEVDMSAAQVAVYYISGPAVICCHVADGAGQLIGFQALDRNPALPACWGDIGTFVADSLQRSGVGRALFEATKIAALAAGITTINAAIRADNRPGLGYYNRRGFVDHGQDPGFALKNGRVVGRILRRYDLM